VQTPFWQLSPAVQLSLSALQLVPSAFGRLPQIPSARQTPSLQTSSSAEQSFGVPRHVPSWQISSVVQASPSSQLVPLALAGLVHSPVPGSQTPASWHWSSGVQTIDGSGMHWPLSQIWQPAHVWPSWAWSGWHWPRASSQVWQTGQVGLHAQEPQSTVS
jgi:hypothetical protein